MSEIRIACSSKDYMNYKDIKPFQGELKSLSKENFEKLKKQILETGFAFPLLVWKNPEDNIVYTLGGHQRLRTIGQLVEREGYQCPDLPVVYVEAANKKEAKKRILQDISQFGHVEQEGLYEFAQLAEISLDELKGFDFPDLDLEKFESSFYEQAGAVEGEDDVPTEVEAKTKLGDLYRLGSHRLLCGDSTNTQQVKILIENNRIELCFTSPPYADQRDYNCSEDLLIPDKLASFITASVESVNYYAVNLGYSRKDGEVNAYWNYYLNKAKANGLKFLSWNVWNRSGFSYTIGQATAMFTIDHEWVFVFGKKSKDLNRTIENKQANVSKKSTIRSSDGTTRPTFGTVGGYRQMGTVFTSDIARYVGEEIKHPAMFPVIFPESYINAMTRSNDKVYDPFGGSGSTLIACEKTKRKCFMMELDPHYCDVIIARWEKFTGQKAEKINP